MRITYANEILKPPEFVFPWIAEPDKAMQWQKNVKGGEVIINRPEVIGTTFKEEIEEGGNILEMYGVITKFIRNQIIEFHLESKIHKLDVSYSVEELNKTTKILVDARINWEFPINLLSIFIGNKMKKGIAEQMESEILELKRICETS
ncbi:MAG: SRPBCC family protein [Candidatus Thorarchaeota archaeon]|jgi:hypothetical protein